MKKHLRFSQIEEIEDVRRRIVLQIKNAASTIRTVLADASGVQALISKNHPR